MTTPALLLAGPIAGRTGAAEALATAGRALSRRGYRILDPILAGTDYQPEHACCEQCAPSWRYWQAVMARLLGSADGVALLPEWWTDTGCCQVADMAETAGLPVAPVNTWMLRALTPAGGWVAT